MANATTSRVDSDLDAQSPAADLVRVYLNGIGKTALLNAADLYKGVGQYDLSLSYSQQVIDANPQLREREALKYLGLVASMTTALERRGVAELEASVTAELGVLTVKIAFARAGSPFKMPSPHASVRLSRSTGSAAAVIELQATTSSLARRAISSSAMSIPNDSSSCWVRSP